MENLKNRKKIKVYFPPPGLFFLLLLCLSTNTGGKRTVSLTSLKKKHIA